MTGNSKLEEIYPEATIEINPRDAQDLSVLTGDWLHLKSRRGEVKARALVTGRSPERTVFLPFHFAEAAANLLTYEKVDNRAKIPDYKNTAIQITKTTAPEGWDAGYEIALTDRGAIKDPVQVH